MRENALMTTMEAILNARNSQFGLCKKQSELLIIAFIQLENPKKRNTSSG
jgi:hypothetical protein